MVAAAGGKNVWIVGGGELAGQFYDHGLLDELFVQVGSVTLGAGKPLLPRTITSPPLRLLSVRAVGTGFAELHYEVPHRKIKVPADWQSEPRRFWCSSRTLSKRPKFSSLVGGLPQRETGAIVTLTDGGELIAEDEDFDREVLDDVPYVAVPAFRGARHCVRSWKNLWKVFAMRVSLERGGRVIEVQRRPT